MCVFVESVDGLCTFCACNLVDAGLTSFTPVIATQYLMLIWKHDWFVQRVALRSSASPRNSCSIEFSFHWWDLFPGLEVSKLPTWEYKPRKHFERKRRKSCHAVELLSQVNQCQLAEVLGHRPAGVSRQWQHRLVITPFLGWIILTYMVMTLDHRVQLREFSLSFELGEMYNYVMCWEADAIWLVNFLLKFVGLTFHMNVPFQINIDLDNFQQTIS